jgi:nicotinamidase-related amidase
LTENIEHLYNDLTPSVEDTFKSNADLHTKLEEQYGITDIVTCGIQSECCVRSTSLGALEAGFNVTVLSGAHSTYDERKGNMRKAGQIERDVDEELEGKGARIRKWEDVVKVWEDTTV